ncbi:protein kinase [Nocardiopsis sp. CT-R113]|uniref:non-specific serine/threonine protein kinase n=1 Tax=Nocardiopsis codii TaxID=3065942 RepID=A0ABU7K959_9ACTN|nr:protein kinase [Nocardiopsis sp. CT-R113]MEE2038770.1 protein kinase [Nocardiopsis sp. CT-R113]
MHATPERIADRYELVSTISTGGMGRVWRGYDTVLDRPVAVKVIRPDAVADPERYDEYADRFKREARVTARIEHPGVPAVYDAAVDKDLGSLYLVMQLVRGVSLADTIAEAAPLTVPAAASVAAQVCAVLSQAHAVPVVHRDLKPGNIMVADDGTVKVLDFGIAAVLRTDVTRLTHTGSILGTYAYMPPEQVHGLPATPGSDLYSLGCVLYELLTRRTVFSGDYNHFQLQVAHVQEQPVPPSEHVADLPEDLERLVLELLDKDPEHRPASAQDVYDRLVPHLPQPDPSAPDRPLAPGALPDPTRPYRRPMAPRPKAPVPAPTKPLPSTPGDTVAQAFPVPGLAPGELVEADEHAQELLAEGRFAQAVGVLDDVIDPAAAALGGESAQVVELRLLRANALAISGDARRALPEFTALADILERRAGHDDERALICRQQAAYCMAQLGETTRALRAAEDVFDRFRRVSGERSEDALDLRREIAMWRLRSGETEHAARELHELYADLRAEYGPGAPEAIQVAEILNRLRRGRDAR